MRYALVSIVSLLLGMGVWQFVLSGFIFSGSDGAIVDTGIFFGNVASVDTTHHFFIVRNEHSSATGGLLDMRFSYSDDTEYFEQKKQHGVIAILPLQNSLDTGKIIEGDVVRVVFHVKGVSLHAVLISHILDQ